MRKRMTFVLIPSLLLIGVLAWLIFSQFSNQLPAEAQDILDSYMEAVPGEVTLTTVTYAPDYEAFSAEMGRSILHAPITEYRNSPVTYDGDIIRAPEEPSQFPFPAQQVWCVVLTRQDQTDEYYFLARHDNLYGVTWVLYQSRFGKEAADTVGCDPL